MLFLFSIICCFTYNGYAQKFYFENYTVNNNLPSSHITSIFQDSYGFVWIGTAEGIRKFNGNEFKSPYGVTDDHFNDAVNGIIETKEHIYFSTSKSLFESYGSYFEEYSFYEASGKAVINKILEIDSKIYLFTTNGIWIFENKQFKKYVTQTKIDAENITTVLLDDNQNLWLSDESSDLYIFNLKTKKTVTSKYFGLDSPLSGRIKALAQTNNKQVFISIESKGIYKYDMTSRTIESVMPSNTVDLRYVVDIEVDKNNDVWFAALNEGVVKYDGKSFVKYGSRNGLNNSDIFTLNIDAENNVWIGTVTGGLYILKRNQFVLYDDEHGLPSNTILNVVKDKLGNVHVVTDKGAVIYDGKEISPYKTTTNEKPSCAAINNYDSSIVLGYEDGSIRFVKDNTGLLSEKITISQYEITVIKSYKKDELMVATLHGDLYTYSLRTNKVTVLSDNIAPLAIYTIDIDKRGIVWIGTEKGIYNITNNKKLQKAFAEKEIISNTEIYQLKSVNDQLIIATGCCGLWRYSFFSNSLIALTKKQGLPSNSIRSFYTDGSQETFVTTTNVFNQILFNDTSAKVIQFKSYSNNNVIEFARGVLDCDKSGNIIAGTNKGLLIFTSLKDSIGKLPPKVVISEIRLLNATTDWHKGFTINSKTGLPHNLILNYNQNDITFEYGGIKYGTNEKFYYSYKLEGYQDSWINTGQDVKAIFSNLPDGEYRFLVRVSNNNLTWSNPLSYKFTIKAPLWKSKAFFGLLLVFFGLLFVVLFRRHILFKNELINNSDATNISLQSARLILFFGSVIFPVASLFYAFVYSDFDSKLIIQLVVSVALLSVATASFFSKLITKHITTVLSLAYYFVTISFLYITYASHIHPFFMMCVLLIIAIGSAIIDKLKPYLIFSVVVFVLSVSVVVFTQKAIFSPALFLFAVATALTIVLLTILVKLNLSEKLIFADTVINKGNTLVLAIDAKKGDVIYASKSFEKMLGYKDDEVLGQGWWNIRKNEIDIETIKSQINDYSVKDQSAELVKTKNNLFKWIQWENSFLDSDLIIGIGSDITEKKEYIERFKYLVENAKDVIYTTDVKGKFTYTNEIAEAYTGYTREELFTKNFKELIHPDYRDAVVDAYTSQLKNKVDETYLEFPIVTKDGVTRWMGQSVKFIFNEITKRFTSVQAICRDVTDRVMAEETLKNNNRRLATLNRTKEKILASPSIEDMCESVLDTLLTMEMCDGISIKLFYDEILLTREFKIDKDENFKIQETQNLSSRDIKEYFLRSRYFMSGDILVNPVVHEQTNKELVDANIRSAMQYGLFDKNKCYGVLAFFSEDVDAYSSQEMVILSDLANSISGFLAQQEQKQIIEEKNKDISDNIQYAKRIQDAIMPPEYLLHATLPQSFVLFKQKDILGGDFYWFDKLGDHLIVVVGDCTGHGVSGSLLSILASNYIKQAAIEKKYIDPATILDFLNRSLQKVLNQYVNESEIKDGLDISIGVLNTKNRQFLFSGAMHNIYFLRNGQLEEIKGNRLPIGAGISKSQSFFCTHLYQLSENDVVYFSTDGYTDQFNGVTGKKYSKAKFKQMLLDMIPIDLTEQKEVLHSKHMEWRGNETQTDDICVIGLKLK